MTVIAKFSTGILQRHAIRHVIYAYTVTRQKSWPTVNFTAKQPTFEQLLHHHHFVNNFQILKENQESHKAFIYIIFMVFYLFKIASKSVEVGLN